MTTNLSVKRIRIVGAIPSFAFQRAKFFSLELHRSLPLRFPLPEIEGLLEFEWYQRLTEWRHLHGSEFCRLHRAVAIFLNDKFIGSDVDLLRIATAGNVFTACIPRKNMGIMKKMFRSEYLSRLRSSELTYCYLDITVDNKFVGTLVFQLYSNLLPKTCENFTTLCLGTKGSFLSYKGSRIHRIVKSGWLQGGDIQYHTGGGGFSIYRDPLEDECYGISHDRRGVLSMANDGKHANGSQFFITLNPTTWMDTYYVAFGQLIEGVKVLNFLENVPTYRERPLQKIEIKNCGKLDLMDVDDIDARYMKESKYVPMKKVPKKIETIAQQLTRLLMEAVTERLAMKEHIPETLHEGDVPSAINLQLYFQGFYSLPQSTLEEAAKYLRTFRRDLGRQLKPTAMEVVEVIAYDLVVGALTKMVDLDDVREATDHPVYEKLINGIDMEVEMLEKKYVSKFVDQLVKTAETMVNFISRKLNWIRKSKRKAQVFQEKMSAWVQSFALQETFIDDNYRIADRPLVKVHEKLHPCDEDSPPVTPEKRKKEKPKKPCCGDEVVKKEKKKRWLSVKTSVDICCDGGEDDSEDEVLRISDFFSSCRYDLKKVERNRKGRMPILDMIEANRFQLRILRHQEKRKKTRERICLEKKINVWMKEIFYVSETEWVRQTVFSREDVCLSHTEELMYGAMTIGLLEMYFLMEEHMKQRKKKYRTRIIYPEEGSSYGEQMPPESVCSTDSSGESATLPRKNSGQKEKPNVNEGAADKSKTGKACTCGDVCCDCTSDHAGDIVGYEKVPPPPTPPPSLITSLSGQDEEEGELMEIEIESHGSKSDGTGSCVSSVLEIDVEDLLAQVTGQTAESVDMSSFKWLQDYVQEEGCLFKSQFVQQVHNFLECGIFDYKGFLSKHSLVSRASLLSFSLSLADLLKEDNEIKTELKDFVYDLWELYFKEMFKETLLQYPQKESTEEAEVVISVTSEEECKDEEVERAGLLNADGDPCSKIKDMLRSGFDFEKFCRENLTATQILSEQTPNQATVDPKSSGSPPDVKSDTEQEMVKPEETPAETPEVVKPAIEVEAKVSQGSKQMKGEDDLPMPSVPAVAQSEEESSINDDKGQYVPAIKRKSPIIIRELIESLEEVRLMTPYTLPFWVKFLTEVIKRALGVLSKMGRLPRRLYYTTDSQISFDDKMKGWIEFNHFCGPTTSGRDIRDYIALHHVNLDNLDSTARSFLRRKVIVELVEKSSRSNSAQILAEELLVELLSVAMEKVEAEGSKREEQSDNMWSDLVATVVKSSTEIFDEDEEEHLDETMKSLENVTDDLPEILGGE